jgi:hypothetical protein
MRKVLLALALVAASFALVVPAANAADCATGVTYNANGSPFLCNIPLSVTVPTAATLTFTVLTTNFGSNLPGTTEIIPDAIVGSFSTNGGTATLDVECDTARPAGFTGTSMFSWSEDGGAYDILDAGPCPNLSVSTRTQVGAGTRAFSDDVRVVVDGTQAAGTYVQELTYTLSVA